MIRTQWTAKEDSFLIENYPHKMATTIASQLNRGVHAVQMRAFRLGINAVDRSGVKVVWTSEQIAYLKANFDKMITEKVAKKLGYSYTIVRMKMRELKLKKCNHARWTAEWDAYLKSNYQLIGNVELAEMFEERFKKPHPWTKKHLVKRLGYLKLKRTKFQLKAINERNILLGRFSECATKRWATTGQFEEGTVRLWKRPGGNIAVIKINGEFVFESRYVWEQAHGEIPKGMAIRHLDGDSTNNEIGNLEMVSLVENGIKNVGCVDLSDEYVAMCLTRKTPELRESVRENKGLINLQRQIYKAKRLCKQV